MLDLRDVAGAHPDGFEWLSDDDQKMLLRLQRETFDYFLENTNSQNGLIADKNQDKAPASTAACGMGLSVYCVADKRGWIKREQAVHRILTLLRFLKQSPQHAKSRSTGHKGFYYHFLDYQSGERMWDSELSTIDTALLMAGALTAAAYFNGDNDAEKDLRDLVDYLYRRIDWQWALNGEATICHGWTPEDGFKRWRWSTDYSEAMILYILAMGAPEHAIPIEGYKQWTATFHLSHCYGQNYLHAGPLFIHQLSHLWLDFAGIRDDFNRSVGFDYFKNSEFATRVQQAYAIENPGGFMFYSEHAWGLTASDGPGPANGEYFGREREFYGYIARGVPDGPDDGTLSPWAVITSLPFAPDIVLPTMRHQFQVLDVWQNRPDGLEASYNPTFRKPDEELGWASPWKFGINEGPVILMLENYASSLIWNLMKTIPAIRLGLERAGFRGGWLDGK